MLPRLQIVHTLGDERGQIYIPVVNWLLCSATLGLVLGFRIVEQPRRRLRHRGLDRPW